VKKHSAYMLTICWMKFGMEWTFGPSNLTLATSHLRQHKFTSATSLTNLKIVLSQKLILVHLNVDVDVADEFERSGK